MPPPNIVSNLLLPVDIFNTFSLISLTSVPFLKPQLSILFAASWIFSTLASLMPTVRIQPTLDIAQFFLHDHYDTHYGTEASCFEFFDICSINTLRLQLVDFCIVLFHLVLSKWFLSFFSLLSLPLFRLPFCLSPFCLHLNIMPIGTNIKSQPRKNSRRRQHKKKLLMVIK